MIFILIQSIIFSDLIRKIHDFQYHFFFLNNIPAPHMHEIFFHVCYKSVMHTLHLQYVVLTNPPQAEHMCLTGLKAKVHTSRQAPYLGSIA